MTMEMFVSQNRTGKEEPGISTDAHRVLDLCRRRSQTAPLSPESWNQSSWGCLPSCCKFHCVCWPRLIGSVRPEGEPMQSCRPDGVIQPLVLLLKKLAAEAQGCEMK
mmetsp:Transcript_61847/g.109845  ORF Transcript_61847/g.109845 Transcript_61847/m.109845 type:complete len:107 (+) Transcript_61847:664-984(+)